MLDTIDLKHTLETSGLSIPVMDLYNGSPNMVLGMTRFEGIGIVHELYQGTIEFLKVPKLLVLLLPAMEEYIKEFFPHLNYIVAPHPITASKPMLVYNVGTRFSNLELGGVDTPSYADAIKRGYWEPTYTMVKASMATVTSATYLTGVHIGLEASQSAANQHCSVRRWVRDVTKAYEACPATPGIAEDDKDYGVAWDTLGTVDYLFIVNYRNQEGKITRCLDSIAKQVPPEGKTFGVLICDDVSTDGSIAVVLEWLLAHKDIKANFRVNFSRAYSALNVYRAVNNFALDQDPIYIELDGDDYLSGTRVLKVLDEEYTPGIRRTLGLFSCTPDKKQDMIDRVRAAKDYTKPYHLGKAAGWAPLRTVRASLARRVEPLYYQDRVTGTWLTKCDDSSIGARLIELAGPGATKFIEVPMYVYDNSGEAHDHDDTWTPLWSHQHLYPAVTF